jgi:histidinol dehydrogenase
MMKVYKYPSVNDLPGLLKRPVIDHSLLEDQIVRVFTDIRKNGDKAVRKYTLEYDNVELNQFKLSEQEKYFGLNQIDPMLFDAIKLAAENISLFHKKQLQQIDRVETMPGVVCWRKSVPIDSVGLYIPGGTAPLFSTVLMLTIPAVIAGCKEIIICTPPSRDGSLHPAIVAAANYIGIEKIFKVGGVQAIAAMTFGTGTIPKVNKIFGPGNQYVTAAKQLAQELGVAIDMPAGPSEVAVYADSTANPSFITADLLSQAEHGADSQVIFVTDHEPLISEVEIAIREQLEKLPRREVARMALANSKTFLVANKFEAFRLLNEYAPEHLILSCTDAESIADLVTNAGSVFIGHFSPESAGDYASGTNHTLPTNGYAKVYSGVSVDSFVKKITFQRLSEEGLKNLAPAVETMAAAEGLDGHAYAVKVRRDFLLNKK